MTTVEARSPKYPAFYDPESGVRFSRGRAEVTEEQALVLATRRFVDGILVEGIPAKKWAQARRSENVADNVDPTEDAAAVPPDHDTDQPVDQGRRGNRRSK